MLNKINIYLKQTSKYTKIQYLYLYFTLLYFYFTFTLLLLYFYFTFLHLEPFGSTTKQKLNKTCPICHAKNTSTAHAQGGKIHTVATPAPKWAYTNSPFTNSMKATVLNL
jgi:hypothetical protein